MICSVILMNDTVVIRLAEHGSSLGTRELGNEIREKVTVLVKSEGKKVLFDCTGVHVLSSAFADELFGKLLSKLGKENFLASIKVNKFDSEEDRKVILLVIRKALEYRETHPAIL